MSTKINQETTNITIVVANIIDKTGVLTTDTYETTTLPSNYKIYTNRKGEIYIFDDGTKKTLITKKHITNYVCNFVQKKNIVL